MENNVNTKRNAIKVSIVAAISLLLLIPLAMIKGVIEDREQRSEAVIMEVANSYAGQQIVSAPYLTSYVLEEKTVDKKIEPSGKHVYIEDYDTYCTQVNYKADVKTDMLHRSIYDVIVYNSKIQISGKLQITDRAIVARDIFFRIKVSDQKGVSNPSKLTLGDQTFDIRRTPYCFEAIVTFPKDIKAGETVDYSISFDLKGTESLFFGSSRLGNTTLTINSPYPHPSFQGAMLPNYREVNDKGFNATWSVSEFNCSSHDNMGG